MERSNEPELTGRKGGGLIGTSLEEAQPHPFLQTTGGAWPLGPFGPRAEVVSLEWKCRGKGGHLVVTQLCFSGC